MHRWLAHLASCPVPAVPNSMHHEKVRYGLDGNPLSAQGTLMLKAQEKGSVVRPTQNPSMAPGPTTSSSAGRGNVAAQSTGIPGPVI